MNVTDKLSGNDNLSALITPELLDAHKPEVLRRVEESDCDVTYAYAIDIYTDDLLLDCFVSAANEFVAEEIFEGAELHLRVSKKGQYIEWFVAEMPNISRLYNLPHDTANVIRFLESYMDLDIQMPLIPVRLSDSLTLDSGTLFLNQRPMTMVYPDSEALLRIEPHPVGASMGHVLFKNSDGHTGIVAVDQILCQPRP